ncbi:MAG: translation elongation factor Ts, partial [Candidatus Omnitrophica bacterium]|nr:translation elongation factor Ts [Candidatus Omnitrophota bacterium]
MAITMDQIKQLREKTNAGFMDCKDALTQSNGDMEKAIEELRKKGLATASRRAGKSTKEGLVESYIHLGGKIGVMLEVNCETDFVARNEKFKEFVRDIAMHIAASNPHYLNSLQVPA